MKVCISDSVSSNEYLGQKLPNMCAKYINHTLHAEEKSIKNVLEAMKKLFT